VGGHSQLFKRDEWRILTSMRRLVLSLLFIASAAGAQPPVWMPGMPWAPLAPYITVGQDEAGYRNWYLASPAHAASVKTFNDYLTTYGVGGVVPTWQLLRTASDWQRCGSPAFEVPPTYDWPNVVQTLRYVRDKVIPTVGPVEPVSVYRNPYLNQCAGGAQESAHRFMQAVDMVPLHPITRDVLIQRLCAVHARSGEPYGVGLGFYVGLRFHVDSRKFRTWGVNDEGAIACARSFEIAHARDAADAAGQVPVLPSPSAAPAQAIAQPPKS
jgi:hypothetical protein